MGVPSGPAVSSRKGVHFDETNLEENERLKEELNCTKIDEPKTPYHYGDESDGDESDGDESDGDESDGDESDSHSEGEAGSEGGRRDEEGDRADRPSEDPLMAAADDQGVPAGVPAARFAARPGHRVDSHALKRERDSRPRDPRLMQNAFQVALEQHDAREQEEEAQRQEKKKAFEEARRRHYGNIGLGMRFGSLMKSKDADDSDEDG